VGKVATLAAKSGTQSGNLRNNYRYDNKVVEVKKENLTKDQGISGNQWEGGKGDYSSCL